MAEPEQKSGETPEDAHSAPAEAGEDAAPAARKSSPWLSVAVDYGPLIVFLIAFRYFSPAESGDSIATIAAVVKSTGAFIVAAIVALIASRLILGSVSRMLMLSTLLIVGFGGLTILLRDPVFVQLKPTALYIFFGLVLLIGWMRGKALLQWLLEAAFPGLDEEGWLKLSRNWGGFFMVLAALNEVLRYFYNAENGGFETWLWAKFWVFMPASFLFTFTQIPMLMRHGLGQEEAVDDVTHLPPTGD